MILLRKRTITLLAIIGLLIIIGGGFVLARVLENGNGGGVKEPPVSDDGTSVTWPVTDPPKEGESDTDNTPPVSGEGELEFGEVTKEGEFLCLPHRDTSGPVTLECAFGLKTTAGIYYALDFNEVPEYQNTAMNQRIRVQGMVVPVEALSSMIGRIYPIVGVIRVSEVETVK